jgi:hypothetical protein
MSKYPLPPGAAAFEVVDRFLPIRKANYVIDWWQNPCSAPFEVYVETALPAFLEVIVFMITLTPQDLIKSHVERSTKRGARRRAVALGRRGATKTERALKHFWRIEGLAERGLFWWAVVDLAVDGAYRWTVLMDQTIWCSGGGSLLAEQKNYSPAISPSWLPFTVSNVIQNTEPWLYTGSLVSAGRGEYHALLTITVHQAGPFGPFRNFQIRLTASVGGEHFEAVSDPVDLNTTSGTTVMISLSMPDRPNTSVSCGFAMRADAGLVNFVYIEDATFSFSEVKKSVKAPPPYDFGTDSFFSWFGFGPEQLKDQFGKTKQDLYVPMVPFKA